MDVKKKDLRWYVGSVMFVLFSILGLTGLTNWLLIPRGNELERGVALFLRHFLRDIHEWMGLFFIILVLVHLWLHKDYIVTNWKIYFGKKQ